MNILASSLIALSLFDSVGPSVIPKDPGPDTAYAVSGKGVLTIEVDAAQTLGSIALGATRVPMMTLNVSASCDSDIKLQTIEVHHTGFGRTSDITGVYATSGYRRISRAAVFNSKSQTAVLRFTNVTIAKCNAEKIVIMADISQTADVAGEHGIEIQSASAIQSSAKEATLETSDATALTVTRPLNVGSVTARFLPITGRLGYGRIETVARIQLTADPKNSHWIKSITLTNQETARDMDLINFSLETRNGQKLNAPVFRMYGREVTIPIPEGFRLDQGQTVVLILKAEVKITNYRKVDFGIEEASDIVATPARAQ